MVFDRDFDFARDYISADETVLWEGKPGKGNLIAKSDIVLIPFSIFWFGFAIFWTWTTFSMGAGFMSIFGIPFVAIGLYLTLGRFVHKSIIRKKTAYVITDRKIIRSRSGNIDIFELRNLPNMHITVHKEGYGTITFGREYDYYYTRRHGYGYGRGYLTYNDPTPSLENVPDVARVHQIISDAVSNARKKESEA